jgi:hypothetical protein
MEGKFYQSKIERLHLLCAGIAVLYIIYLAKSTSIFKCNNSFKEMVSVGPVSFL